MTCKLCEKFREKYPLCRGKHVTGDNLVMDPISCAFEYSSHRDEFWEENWNCQTMVALRDLLEEAGVKLWDNDTNYAILPIPESNLKGVQRGALVLSWYKRRGTTSHAFVIDPEEALPKLLTLVTAEYLLGEYE
jgi:hypothetical protein